MQPGEFVCRAAVHPKYKVGDVFDEVSFFNFVRKKSKYPYMTSVTSFDIAGSEEEVHRAGREIADRSNEREQEKSERRPDYEPQRFHYLGYYSLLSSEVHLFKSDYHRSEIHWRPEDGSNAHFHIELCLIDPSLSDSVDPDDLKSDKDAMASLLADLMLGPTLCPIAAQDEELRTLQVQTLKERHRNLVSRTALPSP